MSQCTDILAHLQLRPITPLEALSQYGCFRLAARIRDLRDQGHNIETKELQLENGKSIAEYTLVKPEPQKPVVHYKGEAYVAGVGGRAFLQPIDHPNHLDGHKVSNMNTVTTSEVIAYDPATGRIETQNTVYIPLGATS